MISSKSRSDSWARTFFGVAGERVDEDADCSVGSTLAYDEVGGKVPHLPAAAQRRGFRSDVQHQVAKLLTLVLGGRCHGRRVPVWSSTRPGGVRQMAISVIGMTNSMAAKAARRFWDDNAHWAIPRHTRRSNG